MKEYYNRFDPKAGYDRTLFLAGRGLQSAALCDEARKLTGVDTVFVFTF